MIMKTCTKCKQEKELTEFYKDKGSKDGKKNSCKCCDKKRANEWHKANPNLEGNRIRAAVWRDANPQRSKELNELWRKKNPEKSKAYKAYYKEMRELQEEAGFEQC